MTSFASALFADEEQVGQVRDALECLLRDGYAEDAAERLETALLALDELGHPIVPVCREVAANGVEVLGWEKIATGLTRLYSSDKPVTALSIDISCHGDKDDGPGSSEPYIETSFYSDGVFPFSSATRAQIKDGYSTSGSAWAGGFEDIDGTIETRGLGRLNEAIAELEADIRTGLNDDGADHDAYFIAAAYSAVVLHLAVRETVMSRGLPRPLAIFVGSNESYPFFDAPVVSIDEYQMIAPQIAAATKASKIEDEDGVEQNAASDAEIAESLDPSEAEGSDVAVGEESDVALESEADADVESKTIPVADPEAILPAIDDALVPDSDVQPAPANIGTDAEESAEPESDQSDPDEAKTDVDNANYDPQVDAKQEDATGTSLRRRLSQIQEEAAASEPSEPDVVEKPGLLSQIFKRKRA